MTEPNRLIKFRSPYKIVATPHPRDAHHMWCADGTMFVEIMPILGHSRHNAYPSWLFFASENYLVRWTIAG